MKKHPTLLRVSAGLLKLHTVDLKALLKATFLLLLINFNVNLFAQSANALKFDPSQPYTDVSRLNYVAVNSPFTAFQKEMTVEFWMYTPNANMPFGSVMGQGTFNVDQNVVWLMHPNTNGTMTFYVSDGGNLRSATCNITANSWHHYAGVASPSGMKFYVDGVLVGSGSGITGSVYGNSGSVLHIGKDVRYATRNIPNNDPTNRYATMTIDEVRIWSRALCAAEINYNKNAEINPSGQIGLQEYYRFNQGTAGGNNASETSVIDLSSNGRNGALVNFTLNGANSNWVTSGSTNTGVVNPFVVSTAPIQGNTSVCLTGSTTLSNANSGGTWSSSNTAVATINASGVVTPISAGSTTISYSIDCGGVSTATVTVNALPTATVSPSGSITICQGSSVTLNAGTGSGYTYQWRLNGNDISGANSSSYTAAVAGSYTVAVTQNGCTTVSSGANVTVTPSPAAAISPVGSTTLCAGSAITLNANTGSGLSYQWRLDGNNISGATNANYIANTVGSYTVVVTQNGCSSISNAVVISADQTPPVAVCKNVNLTLNASGTASIVIPATTSTLLYEDWSGDNQGYYANTSTLNWNVTGDIDRADYVPGMPGVEIDLAGFANGIIESKQTFNFTPGSYTFSFQQVANTLGGNGVKVDIGSLLSQTFISQLVITNESVTFTVTSNVSAKVKLTEVGPSDPAGSFIGSIRLVRNIASTLAIENGSSDNCNIASITASKTEFNCSNIGPNIVTLTVTDNSGNVATCQSTVTVSDNIPPTISSCPLNMTTVATSAAGAVVNYVTPSANDVCPVTVVRTAGLASGSTFPLGTTTVTHRATDAGGNAVNCSFTVTVSGVAPVIVSPGTIHVSSTGSCSGIATFAATETTGIPASTITYSRASGSVFPVGTTPVTATATNAVGSSSVTFNVVVTDNQAPTAIAQDITVNLNASGLATITAAQVNNGSNDDCGIKSLAVSPSSFTCANLGANTVTLTVTDNNNNVSTATAIVTVTGTDNDGDGVANVCDADDDNDGITDAMECNKSNFYWSNAPTLTSTNTAGGTINGIAYTYTSSSPVEFTSTMYSGGTFPASYGVPYNNTTIKNIAVTNNTLTFASPMTNPVLVFASIGQGGVRVPISFGAPVQVVWSQNVTVNSSTQITGEEGYAIVRMMGTFSSITFNYQAAENWCNFAFGADFQTCPDTDNDGIADNMDLDSDNDGCPDAIEGGAHFTLAQTTNGMLNGAVAANGIPTIAGSGQSNGSSQSYIVNCFCQPDIDKTPPTAIAQDLTVNLNASGSATITAAQINNGSSDACGIKSITVNPSSFDCSSIGNNTVTLTVTDNNNNTSTATAVVTVLDQIAPVITCTANKSVNTDANKCGAVVNYNAPTATDNCSGGSTNPVVNGSFENNYNGWTITSSSCGIWVIGNNGQVLNSGQTVFNYGTGTNASVTYPQGLPITFHTTDGNKMAGFFQNCGATHKLYQDVTLPYGNVKLSLDFMYKNFAGSFSGSQFTAIEIRNPSNNALLQTLFKTNPGDPNSISMTTFNFNLSAYAGQTVRLQLVDAVINSNPLNVFIDNVKVTGGISMIQTAGLASGSLFPVGTTTNTFVATDSSGNSSTCSFTVEVIDNQAPIITCNANIALLATSAAGVEVNFPTPTATDNCSATVTQIAGPASGSTFPIGITTVTYQAVDPAGNTSTCSFTVNVTGLPPVIVNPGTITVNTDAEDCGANVQYAATETTGIPASVITYSIAPGSHFNTGTTQVTATATNAVGSSSCTFDVVVEDHEAPTVVTQNISVDLDANGSASITAAQINNGSSDACGVTSLSLDNSTFTCANVGPNTVTLTVTDANGNANSATAVVTVKDQIVPTVVTNNITIQLDANGTASITPAQINNGSTDNCSIETYALDNTSFTCANVGLNTVTLTVTDVNGNINSAAAVVTVQDLIAPTVVTNNITVQLDANGTASITPAQINNGSTDNCSIATYALDNTSFTCANVGLNTVSLTVIDVNGNVNSATAVVTVQDQIAPTVVTNNLTVQLDANGTASITPAQINNGSTDNCSIATYALNNTSFTCANVGNNTVTLTVTDANGNVNSATAVVTVQDQIAPTVVTNNITVQLAANGTASITPAQINNGSTDNCSIATYALDNTSFTCANVGPNTVTLTVTDVNGNVNSATAVVTVKDQIAPTVVTNNITVQLDANGAVSITPAQINNGSTDNCSIASYALDKTVFTCANVGNNTVVLTVTDVNGNSNTANATVVVQDVTAPVVFTQPVTVTLANGVASITAAQVNNGSTDACGIATLSVSPNSFTCSNIGLNTVVLTVTDVNGNVSSANAQVTVIGAIPTVSISQGVQPGFTQGGAVVLTASSPTAIKYNWTGGPNNPVYYVYGSGTYTVTATNSYGCTVTGSTSVNYNASNLLSSYTIIGTSEEVELEDHVIVNNGGVGNTSIKGKVEVEDRSFVTASGTFVRAKNIEVKSSSLVSNQILSATPTSILPAFLYNPYCNSNDRCRDRHHESCGNSDRGCSGSCRNSHHVNCSNNINFYNKNISQNATVVITDTVMGEVVIGKNATVTFTASKIYIKGLQIGEGANVIFTKNAEIRVCNHVNMQKGVDFNQVNSTIVTMYVEKKFDVDEGSNVTVHVYAKEDISINGKSTAPTVMKGLFIGEEVKANDYVNFYWNTNVNVNGTFSKTELAADESGLIGDYFEANVYPNPTTTTFNVKLFSSSTEPFNITVYDMNGRLVENITVDNSTLNSEMGAEYSSGVYLVQINQGENTKTLRLIRAQ